MTVKRGLSPITNSTYVTNDNGKLYLLIMIYRSPNAAHRTKVGENQT